MLSAWNTNSFLKLGKIFLLFIMTGSGKWPAHSLVWNCKVKLGDLEKLQLLILRAMWNFLMERFVFSEPHRSVRSRQHPQHYHSNALIIPRIIVLCIPKYWNLWPRQGTIINVLMMWTWPLTGQLKQKTTTITTTAAVKTTSNNHNNLFFLNEGSYTFVNIFKSLLIK